MTFAGRYIRSFQTTNIAFDPSSYHRYPSTHPRSSTNCNATAASTATMDTLPAHYYYFFWLFEPVR
jgi:hypothetical protein